MVHATSATLASITASSSSPSRLPSSSPSSARSASSCSRFSASAHLLLLMTCAASIVATRSEVDQERRRLAVLVAIAGVIVVSILGAAADVITPGDD